MRRIAFSSYDQPALGHVPASTAAVRALALLTTAGSDPA
jgi:hypothetical protein